MDEGVAISMKKTSYFYLCLIKDALRREIYHKTAGFSALHTDAHHGIMTPVHTPQASFPSENRSCQAFSQHHGAFHRRAIRH